MGEINQRIYLNQAMPTVDGPILEIGSKDYGNTVSFRSSYPGQEYVGVDLAAGKGVDLVADLTQGTGGLPLDYFALVVCCSVLEHVRRPWAMADCISRLVRPGGKLFVSVPWVWRYHPYPDDYFRFSPNGIIELFPDFDWSHVRYSTNIPGEFFDVSPETLFGVDDRMAFLKRTNLGTRKYLPYLIVNMLGSKRRRAEIQINGP